MQWRPDIALHNVFCLATAARLLSVAIRAHVPLREVHETGVRRKEQAMQLSMRLNVLAMIFSFGFIGALVLGML